MFRKTNLGISNFMCAGIIFLLAIITGFYSSETIFAWPFIALVAYVLVKEDDLWLKASAIKAVLIILLFALIPFFFSFVYDFLGFINFFLGIAESTKLNDGWGIINFIEMIIRIAEKVFLFLLAMFAFKGKTVKIPVVDEMIRKHLS